MHAIVATRIRYGYRCVHVMLKREGWQVGRNVVYRLYREEGLVLRTKQPRRRKMTVHREARCKPRLGPCKSEANAGPGLPTPSASTKHALTFNMDHPVGAGKQNKMRRIFYYVR